MAERPFTGQDPVTGRFLPGNSGGGVSKYKPEFCEKVIALGCEGMTTVEMARALGVDRTTFWDWTKSNAEFAAAVKSGIDAAQAWWETQGRIATFGGIKDFNATSYIFQMKNRFREDWRDKVEQHSTGAMTLNVATGVPRDASDD